MRDLETLSIVELLQLQGRALSELRRRNVVRSANGPLGDYAELLFARCFGWELLSNSSSGHDAVDTQGARYQIKCRRVTPHDKTRQLSAIRNLANRPFDVLAAALFDEEYRVFRAALIPVDVVAVHSAFSNHVNAHRFLLRDAVWSLDGVTDVTAGLRATQLAMD